MRLAIISDIHEDRVSLHNAMEKISQFEIDKIICLGDMVGFENGHYSFGETKSASRSIKLIQENSDISIAGNHDINAIGRLPHFAGEINFPENWYKISMDERIKKYFRTFFLYQDEVENDLSELEKDYIKSLNSWKILESEKNRILLSHFLYPDLNGNLKRFAAKRKNFYMHFVWMEKLGANISFVGHAHIEGVGIVRKRSFKISNFGKYSLGNEPQIIMCPCIASGKQRNGFVLFDSKEMILEAIGL